MRVLSFEPLKVWRRFSLFYQFGLYSQFCRGDNNSTSFSIFPGHHKATNLGRFCCCEYFCCTRLKSAIVKVKHGPHGHSGQSFGDNSKPPPKKPSGWDGYVPRAELLTLGAGWLCVYMSAKSQRQVSAASTPILVTNCLVNIMYCNVQLRTWTCKDSWPFKSQYKLAFLSPMYS